MVSVIDWDNYYFNLIDQIKTRSKDPNTKVGCLVIGEDKSIRVTGYNSFPRGIRDDKLERYERPEKYEWIVHSEENAICSAAKTGIPLEGCTIYCNLLPCMRCACSIVQVGVKAVIYDQKAFDVWRPNTPKYNDDYRRVFELFSEANVYCGGFVRT